MADTSFRKIFPFQTKHTRTIITGMFNAFGDGNRVYYTIEHFASKKLSIVAIIIIAVVQSSVSESCCTRVHLG